MKFLLIISILFYIAFSQKQLGICILKGTALDPTITGVVKFYLDATETNIIVEANITGITQNLGLSHGMHVHQWGDISNVNGTSAGPHYVGGGVAYHSCPSNATRHAGDMGDWNVTAGGVILQNKTLDLLPILNSTNSIIGRAVILHNSSDDCVTQPTGNSGARLAQCVIGVANPTSFNTTSTNVAYADNSNTTLGTCYLTPTSLGGNISGIIYFSFSNNLVFITGQFYNLNASITSRGIHIHQFGDISAIDGTAAGPHYNPDSYQHAIPPTVQRHKGDLGNLQFVDGNGVFWYYANNSYVNLSGANNIIGRSVILHITFDDGCTQPTGNSGSRIGQCVIGVADSATVVVPTAPSGIPDQQQPICSVITTSPTTSPATNSPATSSPATISPVTNSPATTNPPATSSPTNSPATNSPATNSPATNTPTNKPNSSNFLSANLITLIFLIILSLLN